MKRTVFAIACLTGGTFTAAAALVFYFGCCVLPFHRVLHRIVPMCALTKIAHHEQKPVTPPAAKKSFPTIRLATVAAPPPRFAAGRVSFASVCDLPRNRMTVGALRCDDDIGLHTLLATFLI